MIRTLTPRFDFVFGKPLAAMQHELDQLFNAVAGTTNGAEGGFSAPANLWEEEGVWRLEVDLPGVKQEDIDVTFENGSLRIMAERKAPEDNRKYWRQERGYGRVERLVSLPETVDSSAIEAEFRDGVLHLKLEKKPELQPKKITVK